MLAQAEEEKPMQELDDKGCTHTSSAQVEETLRTKSKECGELCVVHTTEAQPTGDHLVGSKVDVMDTRVGPKGPLAHLN